MLKNVKTLIQKTINVACLSDSNYDEYFEMQKETWAGVSYI